jgi:hypothetical protein
LIEPAPTSRTSTPSTQLGDRTIRRPGETTRQGWQDLRFTEVSFRFWPRRRHSAPFPAGECLHSAATGRPRERSGSLMARSRASRSPGGAPSTRPQAQFARDEKKAQQSLCRAATIGSSGRHAMWAPYTPTCGAGRRPTLPAAARWRLSSRRLVEREAVSGALRHTSPLLADRNDARAGQRCRHRHPRRKLQLQRKF